MTDLEEISRMSLLARMPDPLKEKVANIFIDISERAEAAAGKDIVQEGYLGFGSGYILLSGVVEIQSGTADPVRLKGPTVLGEMAQFFDDDTRTATIRAEDPIEYLRFSWDDLYEKAGETLNPDELLRLRESVELVIWKRFKMQPISQLQLFTDLDEDLKVRVSLPFPWISKRALFKPGEVIFKEGSACDGRGYLLTRGEIQLSQSAGGETLVRAPNILGIMPTDKPDRVWTATAQAGSDVEVLEFSWDRYNKLLHERLSAGEVDQLAKSMKNFARSHFWH